RALSSASVPSRRWRTTMSASGDHGADATYMPSRNITLPNNSDQTGRRTMAQASARRRRNGPTLSSSHCHMADDIIVRLLSAAGTYPDLLPGTVLSAIPLG